MRETKKTAFVLIYIRKAERVVWENPDVGPRSTHKDYIFWVRRDERQVQRSVAKMLR